ncbi:hypothetical protein [Bradyrhizobium sp. CCGB20]|uniref:hypothetical protein n=1 Tax=Bradyrhizobium sp. CCGB20 TaxID=2949633 RepID=UPI0020B17DCB|nr:hypothetical protein [Bradyrhizobium sp. CCGB20]MCP3400392.1 hypothetical protein [Bradyrhizobium sp. CCGB20]
MEQEIRIDIGPFFRRHGRKPSGRGYWVFQIVSPLATAKDHILAPQEEMAFKAACERALEVAALRRATRVLLLPE